MIVPFFMLIFVEFGKMKDIGSGAFENCTALSSVKIADHGKKSLKVYGSAFKNCTSLKKIVLPAKTNFYEEYDLPKSCRVIRR